MSIDKDKVLSRVQKLLAQATHQNTSQEESEVFFEKAFALMEEHALTDADLRSAADPAQDPMTHVDIKLSSSTWRSDVTLGTFVARLTDTFVLRTGYNSYSGAWVHFYGRTTNVARATELFKALMAQANRVAASHRDEARQRYSDPRKYIQSVREGFIVALCRRLEQRHISRQAPTPPGVGIVPVSLVDEAEAFAKDQTGFTDGRRSSRSVDARGWSQGRAAGESAPLGDAALGGRRALGR